jgi:FAD/FMN-containing dehydrogenase
LGGAAASNIHGKNHHGSGSLEHFLEWLEVATPSGVLACGPKENADLFRATVGGYGLTGVITRLRLRLRRIASPWIRARALRCRGLEEMFAAFRAHDSGSEYSVAWVDTLAGGKALGRGILFLGDHAENPGGKVSAAPRHELFSIPFPLPDGMLHPRALALFNQAYYRLPRPETPALRPYQGFFYPLDRIGNWNRLYGPNGFFQYKCALPDPGGEKAVAEILAFLARHGLGSFLAVLKRCGDDTVMLPFCRRGFTLALDVPNRGVATLKRLSELDERVTAQGGRVYLTKDARLSPQAFRAQYPEWRDWMAAVKRYNPEGICRSLLSERLGLWDA